MRQITHRKADMTGAAIKRRVPTDDQKVAVAVNLENIKRLPPGR
jgi:hypothetical protein